jgi:hypothetical protein
MEGKSGERRADWSLLVQCNGDAGIGIRPSADAGTRLLVEGAARGAGGGEREQARSGGLIDRRRDTRRYLVGRVLDRISRQTRIPRRRLNLHMSEQLAASGAPEVDAK